MIEAPIKLNLICFIEYSLCFVNNISDISKKNLIALLFKVLKSLKDAQQVGKNSDLKRESRFIC